MHGLASAICAFVFMPFADQRWPICACSCVMAHWNSDARADQRWPNSDGTVMHKLTSAGLSVPVHMSI